ncbi:MAG: SLC26A/SulP transporter family protein [Opitutales bacterium]
MEVTGSLGLDSRLGDLGYLKFGGWDLGNLKKRSMADPQNRGNQSQQAQVNNGLGRVWGELRDECHAANLVPALAAGLIVAISAVVTGTGVATLLFTGPLLPHIMNGIGLVLFSAVVLLVVTALGSSYRGSISLPQEVPAVVASLLAVSLYQALEPELGPAGALPVVVLGIALGTLFTGLIFLLLGKRRLGGLIRYIPFPVVGGVLAALGWLLIQGAVSLLSGEALRLDNLGRFADPAFNAKIGISLVFGILLYLASVRIQHFLTVPLVLVGGVGLFYLAVWLSGTELEAVIGAGWLLGPFPDGDLWRPPSAETLAAADWGLLLKQVPVMGTLVLASVITLLLHASGLELAVRREIDLNHELVNCGLANILAGLGGGTVGFHSLSDSVLVREMRAPFRITSLIAAALLATGLAFGFSALGYFPRPVLGGLLFFLAIGLLLEWVVRAARRLPVGDYLVVLLILVVAGAVGFLEAIGVGIIAGVVIFTINYSRVNVTKHVLSGASMRSNVDRPASEREILDRHGDSTLVLRLQGFLFFGTANLLLDPVRERLEAAAQGSLPLRFLCLDFRLINGIDTSAVITFKKLDQLAENLDFEILLTELSAEDYRLLETSGLPIQSNERIHRYPDLDRGLEHCEESLLAEHRGSERAGGLRVDLETLKVRGVLAYAQNQQFAKGETIIRQGDPSDDLFFIRKGRVSVHLEGIDLGDRRLKSYGPGTLVGEVALYTGVKRTASVRADEAVEAFCFDRLSMERMEREAPEAAAFLHRFVATELAERLTSLNRLVQSMG